MSEQEYADPDDPTWWFNINTKEVEHGRVSPGPDRLGPFTSRADAERALETVEARSRAWAEEEAQEDNWGSSK